MQCYNGHIVFSYTQRGKAANIHFGCDKKGVKYIKQALNDFCLWLFRTYEWCRMVLGMADEKNRMVEKIGKACGFSKIGKADGVVIYARAR